MTQPNDRLRIAIVGGGIAGLAAAFRLTQIAPAAQITLIERDDHLGGKITTERVDGFVIEGGPDSFLSSKPRGIGLCQELGLDDRLQGVEQATRRTYVMRDGRLHDLPEGLTGLIPTRLKPILASGLLSPAGKARLALDYVMPARRGDGDETLASFIQRRLGREAYERLVEPLMAGIYAGDGRQLSLAATFPQLRRGEVEHGGLIKGVLAARRARSASSEGSSPRSPFLAPRNGMAEMIEALEQRLVLSGVKIMVNTGARQVVPSPHGSYEIAVEDGATIHVDKVVLATPASVTASLIETMLPDAAALLRAIPHVSTALVTFAYPEQALPRPFAGHGYIIPRIEGRPALACTWVSAKWAHRAPEGFALVRVFLGRSGQDSIVASDDTILIDLAREELRTTLDIAALPSLTRVRRWHNGMPQYTPGHLERVAALDLLLNTTPAVALAGHAYRGVGIPDCIASGESAAERVMSSHRGVARDALSAG